MVATKRDSLCMQILREKYKIKHDWLRFNPPRSASPIWKAIEQAKSIIVKGACYLIGDGSSIDVWQDPWVPWYHGFIPKPRDENSTQLSIKVSHLIDHDLHCWKASIINNLFNSTSAKAILSISIPSRHTPDKLIWVLDSKGLFSVKSAHQVLNPPTEALSRSTVNWKKLWNLKAPERTKMFLWRLSVNALPTRANIAKQLDMPKVNCLFYTSSIETPMHLFLTCPKAKTLWFATCWGFKSEEAQASTHEEIVNLTHLPIEVS